MHPAAWSLPCPTIRCRRALGSLERIADTLGCPVEVLLRSAGSDAYPDETAELVRLWFAMTDPRARHAVLRRVRLAADEG